MNERTFYKWAANGNTTNNDMVLETLLLIPERKDSWAAGSAGGGGAAENFLELYFKSKIIYSIWVKVIKKNTWLTKKKQPRQLGSGCFVPAMMRTSLKRNIFNFMLGVHLSRWSCRPIAYLFHGKSLNSICMYCQHWELLGTGILQKKNIMLWAGGVFNIDKGTSVDYSSNKGHWHCFPFS